jgi:hypothetical protein
MIEILNLQKRDLTGALLIAVAVVLVSSGLCCSRFDKVFIAKEQVSGLFCYLRYISEHDPEPDVFNLNALSAYRPRSRPKADI